MSTTELVQLAIDEVWNKRRLELADELFSKGYVNHGGLVPDLVAGPEAVRVSVALYQRAFPTFYITVAEFVVERTGIVIRWIAHTRRPSSLAAAHRAHGLRGITRCRIKDGKIAESWTAWDSRAALLRVVDAPRPAGG
ncbi:MAG: ester cyclase [Chloroflexota bacterium]